MNYILAIDQGTTSTTALLMNRDGIIIADASCEVPQHFPKSGYVEHHAQEIKDSVAASVTTVLNKTPINPNQIAGIALTNQRETTCIFDRKNNSPIPFIVWQCRRSDQICQEIEQKNSAAIKKTGLRLDPYFSSSKLLWIFRNHPEIFQKACNQQYLFGTIDSFLCHWFTHNKLHITDVTNASRTMLMDLKTCAWDDEILDLFSVPKAMLPTITKNIDSFGKTKNLSFLPDDIPILSIIGDQQAALFGQKCFTKGSTKATYGTGSFILQNIGEKVIFSQNDLLTSVAYYLAEKPHYCLEGSAFIAGALIQFLRDNLGIIKNSSDIDELSMTVKDNGGVMFIPALCGLSAPYWRPDAKGLLCGLERGTQKGHIARAALEGIALQNFDLFVAMANDGMLPTAIKVDGGAAHSDILMQIQADLLGQPCFRPNHAQKTALGAAYIAGLACGMFNNLDDIMALPEDGSFFYPNKNRSWASALIEKYHHTLKRAYF